MKMTDDRGFKPGELEHEFQRSGLSKGAFAGFLSIDKALVTRLLASSSAKKRRYWQPGEAAAARTFFALVPERIDGLFVRAVAQLRLSEELARARKVLADYSPLHREFEVGSSIDVSNLRADQLVHLCRVKKIDLAKLVLDREVRRETDAARLNVFKAEVDECYARAERGASPFEVLGARRMQQHSVRKEGHAQSTLQIAANSAPARVTTNLPPADPVDFALLKKCSELVVADDTLEPRYRNGETILLAPDEVDCRHGEDIVVSFIGRKNRMIGRLVLRSRDDIVLDHWTRGRLTFRRDEIASIRRVVACVMG
jgi:hypothetical protein